MRLSAGSPEGTLSSNKANEAVQKIIEAHGGVRLWNQLEGIEANLTASGFIFTMKGVPLMNHVRMRASAHEPRFIFFDYPRAGQNSEFLGDEEVRITSSEGKVLERRLQPRAAMHGLRKFFHWDSLDFTYFAGYATWNYLLFPFLFLKEGFEFRLLEPLTAQGSSWQRLHVTFPSGIPTHSREQVYYLDEHWHLRRHDYTAEVVGHWARAAQLCKGYRDFDGIQSPTWRRIRPRLAGRPLPWPDLIALDIHSIRPIRKGE